MVDNKAFAGTGNILPAPMMDGLVGVNIART
jgi:hypothetical protein